MKPSTLRYVRTEQDVWALLWRLMPKACKEVAKGKKIKVTFTIEDSSSDIVIRNTHNK